MSRRLRPATRAALTALAGLVATSAVAGSAGAAGAAAAGAGTAAGAAGTAVAAELELASQTAWVEPEGELVLRLRVLDDDGDPVAPPPPAVPTSPAGVDPTGGGSQPVITVEVHERLTSRSAFLRTTEGESLGGTVARTSAPLGELGRDVTGAVVVRLGVSTGTAPPTDDGVPRITLRREGVYPLRVLLRADGPAGAVVDELVTHLVRVPAGDDIAPLRAALVVPVHAPPSVTPGGGLDGERRLRPADRTRLEELVNALAAAPPTPITLAPTPETLVGLAAEVRPPDQALLDGLRQLADVHQVLARPYVPVDARELVASGLEAELAEQLTEGAEALNEQLGVRPPARTWLATTPLDQPSLAALRRLGVDQLLVDESLVDPLPLQVTLTQPFAVEDERGRRLLALQADAQLAAHLAGGGDPVLAAHHFLADLAVLFFDQPALERGAVAVAPDRWSPDPRLVETVLAGVASSPILAPASIDGILEDAQPLLERDLPRRRGSEPVVRDLAPIDPFDPADTSAVVDLRSRVESFASMVAPTNPSLAMARELLLVSQSSDLTRSQRRAYLQAAVVALDDQLALIEVPRRRTITLTARTGQVPVTLRNETGHPVDVVVDLESDKLDFPAGSTRRLRLPGGNTTSQFTVETRTSGAFPLEVNVLSPDGATVLGSTRYTIRSTAVSGVGLFLTGGALAFLVVWWGLHLRRNRGSKTPLA